MSGGGAIFLIRHGKPDFPYTNHPGRKISSLHFNSLIQQYDNSGLDTKFNLNLKSRINEQTLIRIEKSVCFVSDLKRAIETAELLNAGKAGGLKGDPGFREVPLPFFSKDFKMSARNLLFLARLRWYLGYPSGEPKKDAFDRAEAAAKLLQKTVTETGKDVTLFSHGFFLYLVQKKLRGLGWSSARKTPFYYLEIRKIVKN